MPGFQLLADLTPRRAENRQLFRLCSLRLRWIENHPMQVVSIKRKARTPAEYRKRMRIAVRVVCRVAPD